MTEQQKPTPRKPRSRPTAKKTPGPRPFDPTPAFRETVAAIGFDPTLRTAHTSKNATVKEFEAVTHR